MMINIEAKKRICIFNFSAEDQTPQTTISSHENVVWEGIVVNRVCTRVASRPPNARARVRNAHARNHLSSTGETPTEFTKW